MTDTRAGTPGPRLVMALGVTQIISWGSIFYAFALLADDLAAAVGAEKTTVVGAFSVALLIAGLASSAVGGLIDRHGGRRLMSGGSLLAAGGLAALTQVQTLPQLYLVWAVLGVSMAATLYDPAFAVLVQAFRDGHRKAITGVTLFGGFASTVFWPLTQALIERFGWQGTLWVLAALQLLVCLPLHARVLPGPPARSEAVPAQRSRPPALRTVYRDPSFYLLCLAFTGSSLVFSALSVHLIPLLHLKGMSLQQAAWIGAMIGPMQVAGRLLEYAFLAKASPSRVGLVAMSLLPASLLLLAALTTQQGGFLLFALLYGAGNGIMTIVRGAIPVQLYGREHYGAVNGAMAGPALIAKAAGPWVASLILAALTQPVHLVWVLAGVAALSAGLFSLAAPLAARRARARAEAV
ncbi:MFS transporter [Caldimonas brevitalea]|uniref:Major facilitator superfamily (MFS) profile domain-containing protein n=1 Tax=Caldimonas brevitalea TaxID=413882 RepID=A0A0G3BLY7_9BURK|nr:MFS transporter [Caldimonas brevitalea]AKJ27575.1 hypothetical protein AAW51_0884 [Caldimonas brevitalea]